MINILNPNSYLSITLWNAIGLKQHKNKLQYLLRKKNIDTVLVTETHQTPIEKLNFHRHNIIRADHPDGTSHADFVILFKTS